MVARLPCMELTCNHQEQGGLQCSVQGYFDTQEAKQELMNIRELEKWMIDKKKK